MKLVSFFFFFLLFFFPKYGHANFRFEGEVNASFTNASAYLLIVDDLNKQNLFEVESILEECEVDSSGFFTFSGDYLEQENRIYRIYIDNCNENISNSKHLLSYCDNHISELFIANNTDEIFFPLNEMNQMFCSLKSNKNDNILISKVDSLRNQLLSTSYKLKNKKQRSRLYQTYYSKLKDFGKQHNEPLIELYISYLHLNKGSFTRLLFIEDVNTTSYYQNLIEKLNSNYPKSRYAELLALELSQISTNKSNTFNSLTFTLLTLLILSFTFNIYLLKNKIESKIDQKTASKIDYKELLTQQEQNVFKLMYEGNTNKDIAELLFISLSTVKTHINSIYTKLKINSRKEIPPFFLEK